ncbi:MAG: hypothetical protein GX085_09375 [Firmicutes bacterium]|nr:hypothetical protein [Bacillota bacterium]
MIGLTLRSRIVTILITALLLVAMALPVAAANLITNGEFDNGTDGWRMQMQSGAICTFDVVQDAGMSGANAAKMTIRRGGQLHWHVECMTFFEMEKDKTYQLSFMAKAAKDRQITVMIQRDFSPYTPYVEEKIDITTEPKMYTITWVSEADDPNTRLNFGLGGNSNDVWWDNVSIVEVGADGAAPVAEVEEVVEVEEEAAVAEVEEPVAEKPAKKMNTALIIAGVVAVLALLLLGKK